MDEHWQPLLAECEKLGKSTGVALPEQLRLDAGPVQVWQKEATLLSALTGFLAEVNDVAGQLVQGQSQRKSR